MTNSAKMRIASPWLKAILICAGFAALYLLIAGSSTLWDRDEPRYARATAEMVESGNYLVPTFNGEVWFDKPILLYWLMSVPVRLLGPSEIACRFAGVIGTAITLLLTFFIGIKLFIEIGPGQVLKGLLKKIDPKLEVKNIATHQDIISLSTPAQPTSTAALS